jgi:hypothetical protein
MTPPTLTEISNYITQGLTERESCILAGFDYNKLQHEKDTNPEVKETLEKKAIEFKFNHLKEIVKNKSEKNSMWLLEKLRPDEFGTKARNSDQPTINIISAIIKDIQNDNQGIVRITRGAVRESKLAAATKRESGAKLLK